MITDQVQEGLPELGPTEHTSMINKDTEKKPSNPHHDSTQGHQMDIYLQTLTGGYVPWQDVKWELNPYAAACRDTLDLLGTAPDHYHLRASHTVTTLCALYKLTSTHSSTKHPLQKSQDFSCNHYGY